MAHDHKHDHNSGHDHHHDHAGHAHDLPKTFGKAFAIGISLNLIFVVVEASYGYFSNSLSLMADAGHNLSDVLGLVLAWAATWFAKRKPSERYTYGFGQTSILSALLNALFLLIAVGGIMWEAVIRLRNPEPVAGSIVIAVATIGIVINGVTALMFMSGRKGDLNIRGAYLHMAADAAVSFGVVIAGIIISYTGALWLDPAVSVVIGFVIVISTWGLLRDSLRLAVAGVPAGVATDEVTKFLESVPGVASIHDLHIWAMSTTETALTAHLVIPGGHPGDQELKRIAHDLDHDFKIQHTTLQIELGELPCGCKLDQRES